MTLDICIPIHLFTKRGLARGVAGLGQLSGWNCSSRT